MKRDLAALSRSTFDLLVVGGGISGACTAWDAALRGLDVALIEKADFGHATSSASSKVVHGGIRYLQQGLVHRLRQSVRERTTFLRIAPHLVRPIPFLIPTYGHGLRGKELLAAGMTAYDLFTRERSRVDDPDQRIPRHRILSRRETLDLVPDVPPRGLTGGVLYHDAQMHSSERTTLAFVRSAAERGAQVANYVEATGLLREGARVVGVQARDGLGGDCFEIRARVVASVTGPWVFGLGDERETMHRRRMAFSKGIHVLTRPLQAECALALATRLPNESIINRGGRHIFLIPWRGHTLIGTTNVSFSGAPEGLRVTERDVVDFLGEINGAWPAARLRREDVRFAYGGLYQLYDDRIREGVFKSPSVYRIFDHGALDGLEGLITVLGARFTTGRLLAADCVDLVFRRLGRASPGCETERTPLRGGEIERIGPFLAEALRERGARFGEAAVRELVSSYGATWPEVVSLAEENADLAAVMSESRPVLRASIVHAVREEMAQTLGDLVFRRTGIGTIGDPGEACLRACADLAARELGWSAGRTEREIDEVHAAFRIAS